MCKHLHRQLLVENGYGTIGGCTRGRWCPGVLWAAASVLMALVALKGAGQKGRPQKLSCFL